MIAPHGVEMAMEVPPRVKCKVVREHSVVTCTNTINLHFFYFNFYLLTKHFNQTIGISMGTHCAHVLANILLYS